MASVLVLCCTWPISGK